MFEYAYGWGSVLEPPDRYRICGYQGLILNPFKHTHTQKHQNEVSYLFAVKLRCFQASIFSPEKPTPRSCRGPFLFPALP